MSLSNEFRFKSTPDGSPPSGRRRKDTFRDVSFTGMKPESIDHIDHECIIQSISRAEWIITALGSKKGKALLYDLLEGVKDRGYARVRKQWAAEFTADRA